MASLLSARVMTVLPCIVLFVTRMLDPAPSCREAMTSWPTVLDWMVNWVLRRGSALFVLVTLRVLLYVHPSMVVVMLASEGSNVS